MPDGAYHSGPREVVKECAAPVLIAGGGPVGLTLAIDLAWRGVASILVEPRRDVDAHPRAISIGVRSMEHFRRLGLDDAVIDAGVPRDRALDVVYAARMLGSELFRFRIPSILELASHRAALCERIPEIAASPYYKVWTAQTPLERVLRQRASLEPLIDLRLGWHVGGFTESAADVAVTITDNTSDARQRIACSYLVGCDGATSPTRHALSIPLQGRGTLGTARGIYFSCPSLARRLGDRPGVMYWSLAADAAGVIYTIDGGDTWVLNRYYASDAEATAEPGDRILQRAIGDTLPLEILSDQTWLPRQLVAERFASNRVFLAGDACHLFVPTGGFGMNTGIGDAADLSWKIAGTLQGWGGPRLLGTYDSERRPVGTRNTLEAADNYFKSTQLLFGLGDIENADPSGDAARKALAERLPSKLKHFAPIGAHLGYHYAGSPIIVSDETPEPQGDAAHYQPTARPGHRAPHVWLKEGLSTLDLFGDGFALLSFAGEHADEARIAAEADRCGIPLRMHRVDNAEATRLYSKRYVLVRPDGHIAWRGDHLDEPARVLAWVTGHSAPSEPASLCLAPAEPCDLVRDWRA